MSDNRVRRRRREQFQDKIARLYPDLIKYDENGSSVRSLTRSITFQVTDNCNLACTYCYQTHKGTRVMSIETAKKFVDLLLSGDKGMSSYVDPSFSPGVIIDFIGGEPFLAIDLIDEICDYFFHEAIRLRHPWAEKHMFSLCSNGVLYRDPKVQKFLKKHHDHISLSITVDGNKELHDSCRIFPNGDPSYEYAVDAVKDWMSRGYYIGSKITIAPENVIYLNSAIRHMIELGYEDINANCVFEKGWTLEHASIFYEQMKTLTDYLIENNLVENIFIALYDENFFKPKEVTDLQNWCGGTGLMLACDPVGYLYPCLRYMESSLGDRRAPLRIGHVDIGIGQTQEAREIIDCLNCIDRRTESTDECFYCPIANGCSWCSAYNYEVHGTPNSRATYICEMHKARALANAYHWAKYYESIGSDTPVELWVPEQWALKIISEDEWKMLCNMKNIVIKNPENKEMIK